MREDGVLRGKGGEETKCACVIFLNLCKYQLHRSRVTNLEMKQVEVQMKKWGGRLNKLDGQEKKDHFGTHRGRN